MTAQCHGASAWRPVILSAMLLCVGPLPAQADPLAAELERIHHLAKTGDVAGAYAALEPLIDSHPREPRVLAARFKILVSWRTKSPSDRDLTTRAIGAARSFADVLEPGVQRDQVLAKARALEAELVGRSAPWPLVEALPGLSDAELLELLTAQSEIHEASSEPDRARKLLLAASAIQRTDALRADHPDALGVWRVRALAALTLGDALVGSEAGTELMRLGAMKSPADEDLMRLMVDLNRRDWLRPRVVQAFEAGSVHRVQDLAKDLVFLSPGSFEMGAHSREDEERPVRRVQLSRGFFLGRTEVTQAQYRAVTGTAPWTREDEIRIDDRAPATYLTWAEAVEFCRLLNERDLTKPAGYEYRLPTEAEWEYAARAGTTGNYSCADTDLARHAVFSGSRSGRHAHPVGSREANPWGLFDLHGNVWEWVQDWYGPYDPAQTQDPTGPSRGTARVLRGGSFEYRAFYLRSAYRDDEAPSYRCEAIGFRVALAPIIPR